MLNAIKKQIGHWIQPSVRADPDLFFRVQVGIVLSVMLGGLALIGTSLVYLSSQDNPFPLLPFIVAQTLLVIAGVGLFSQRWVTSALLTIVMLASSMMIFSAYLTGGLNNVTLMWFPVMPILAGIISGRRIAALMATLCVLSLVAFWYLSHTGHHFPATEAHTPIVWLLSGGSAVAMAGAIVYFNNARNDKRRLSYESEIARRIKVEQSLRHTHQQLRMAMTAAEEGAEAKGAFLAQVSHEIRNPLTAIMGGIDLLALPAEPAVISARMDLLRRSANALYELVEDVQDYSKIVQRQIEITPTHIDIEHLISEVERSYRPRAIETGLELLLEIDPSIPTTMWVDAIRVRQVLTNLIDNAFKFTTEGSITLELSPTVHEDGTPTLTFGVEDTGIGIPDDCFNQLFEPYKHGERSVTATYGGTGLGLPICYHLVTLMNGQLGFETEVGEGSRFWFSLPIEQQPTHQPKPAHSATLSSTQARVLVVENDPLNRQVVGELIESLGHTVTLADDGTGGIQQYQTNQPDLVLMDIQMPGMNGIEASRLIREWEDEQTIEHVPILAMTADLTIQEISNYGKAGMNGLLAKPVSRDKLEEAIQGWAVRRELVTDR